MKNNQNPKTKKISPDRGNAATHVYAMGGLDEVGKNMYCFETPNEMLVIDSGQKFTEKQDFGADAMIPNIYHLERSLNKIFGIFVTHGHEDHIGALPFIIKKMKIKRIFVSPIAKELIINKLRYAKIPFNDNMFHILEVGKPVKTKDFVVTPFYVNHSIPEAMGFHIQDANGSYITTGDFKFDLASLGESASFSLLTKWSEKGVDLLLSDSTNAKVQGFSKSEHEIGKEIRSIVKTTKGRIIISTFASNMYRVKEIVAASIKYGRKICVIGRSMDNAINILIKLGHLDKKNLISEEGLKHNDPAKTLILCTGSQGETLAALKRISDQVHKYVRIEPGDTVIFSSSPIPGNTYYINDLANNIVKQGAHIIESSQFGSIHASGHGYKIEHQLMLNLVRPKYFFPVHGNTSMLYEHKKTALECKIPEKNIFTLLNGDVLEIRNRVVKIAKRKIGARVLFIDNNSGDIMQDNARAESNNLASNGVVVVQLAINKNKKIINSPIVSSRGCVRGKGRLQTKLETIVKDSLLREIKSNPNKSLSHLKEKIETEIANYLSSQIKINPVIIVSLAQNNS